MIILCYTDNNISESLIFIFNKVLNHAPDFPKNETSLSDLKHPLFSASASDKPARYFTDLQHLRKKFWERYRHILIPMIQTQLKKSGIEELSRTSTNLGLRQTKRAANAKRASINFGNIPMWNSNQFDLELPPKYLSSETFSKFLRLLRESRTKEHNQIHPGPTTMDRPPTNRSILQRSAMFGRPSMLTDSPGMVETPMKGNVAKSKDVGDISKMYFLGHSFLCK